MNRNPLWIIANPYGWIIIVMSVVTAILLNEWWVVLFGVIGYQFVLVVELMWGGALGRTGRIRLAKAEQENRELRDEKAHLVGTIEELQNKLEWSGHASPGTTTEEASSPALPTE